MSTRRKRTKNTQRKPLPVITPKIVKSGAEGKAFMPDTAIQPAVMAEPPDQAESKWTHCKRWLNYLFHALERAGLIFLIPTAYVLIVDLEDRQAQRIAQAWQLITQNAPGNSGKVQALEYLNIADCYLPHDPTKWELFKSCGFTALFVSPKQKEPLSGIDLSEKTHSSSVYLYGSKLSRAELRGANLSIANLNKADLSGASLYEADLSGASLLFANLSGTDLYGANLSGANLHEADLSGASLMNANLSGADLVDADLSGARLRGALNLVQQNLDDACGDDKTQLPEGLTIKNCEEK